MVEFFSITNPFILLLIAGALGAFLGIRREMDAQLSNRNKSFMGFRTMALLSVLGALSTLFLTIPWLPVIFFIGICIMLGIAYAHGSFAMNRIGITTELSAMLTFWIGVLVGTGQQTLAIFMTLFLAVINEYKYSLHNLAKTLHKKEWFGAFELLLFSGIVLPFLPKTPIDPWGIFVPFHIWLLVILISGIGFVGYFLIKYLGARGGVPLISVLGSIVSSTAVTISMATKSKELKLPNILAGGIMIALGTMQIRIIIEVFILGTSEMINSFLLVPAAMALSSFVTAYWFFFIEGRKAKKNWNWLRFTNSSKVIESESIKIKNPFEIKSAIKFGIVFVLILFALYFGQRYLGNTGVYIASIFSGIIDIDAIVLSSLESVKLGELSSHIAQNSIIIALFINTIIKIAYVSFLGTLDLVKRISIAIAFVSIAGGIMFLFV